MSKKVLTAFIISILLLLAVIVLNQVSFYDMRSYTNRLDHTRQVITAFENLSSHFKSAQIYSQHFDSAEENEIFRLYREETENIDGELVSLKKLLIGNPSQQNLSDSLSILIGYELDSLQVQDTLMLQPARSPGRLDSYFTIYGLINRGIKNEEGQLNEHAKQLKESTRFNRLVTNAFGILAIGIVIGTFFSAFFLSRHRQWLEGFLESVLNSARNGIVHYEVIRQKQQVADFKISYANKYFYFLFGLQPDAIINKSLKSIPSYAQVNFFEKLRDVIMQEKPDEFEFFYQRGETELWIRASLSPTRRGITASFYDITQLKQFESELKENIQNLEHTNTELEQYAYVASHDLQEPLRKIRAFGSYLQDTQAEKLDLKGRDQLSKIMTSAERMSTLIKDILYFSSLKKREGWEKVDMNLILTGVLQDLDLLVSQKDARIKAAVLPIIDGIPLQITQLFYNLINNSLKFTRAGVPPEITISCRKISNAEREEFFVKQADYYEIIFRDNGIGFNVAYEQQIFGLFKRLNDKTMYPGSGIGLSLCKKVVENHHGEILAHGNENEGASFVVYLPDRQG